MKTAQLPNPESILVVGAGEMSKHYIKVLRALEINFKVICRNKKSAELFYKNNGFEVKSGGLRNYFKEYSDYSHTAIVAVNVKNLASVTKELLLNGFTKILIEKPGALIEKELSEIVEISKEKNSSVLIGYNRRFYSSTRKAKRIIKKDGGVRSFHFDFTERSLLIESLSKDSLEKRRWFLSNSSHVSDLAFFLGGNPVEMDSYTKGEGILSWHPSSSIFSGSGLTDKKSLFSYSANWTGPGRWSLEIITNNNKLIMSPLEKLSTQKIGSFEIHQVPLDDHIDIEFKPGLYRQTKRFIQGKFTDFCSIEDQLRSMKIYKKIASYD